MEYVRGQEKCIWQDLRVDNRATGKYSNDEVMIPFFCLVLAICVGTNGVSSNEYYEHMIFVNGMRL